MSRSDKEMKERVMIRHRRFKVALGAIALAAGAIALAAALQSGQTMVTLCHRAPGSPLGLQTIAVPSKEVSRHLNHGDTLGACPSSPGR